ncbi:MAG: 50S ribosomal protein L11 methyltransferase [Chromatiales bacterium]|nr:50S ribosomal protein L11 methyltransferase [Chromatiales bacterium]
MLWQQLIYPISSNDADELSDRLAASGAAAVTLKDAADEPLYEPPIGTTPLWSNTLVIALFEEGIELGPITATLAQEWSPRQLPEPQIQQLPDQVWERTWMDGFEPMQFGDRLWIVPSWFEEPEPSAVNIKLDPGLAFGTGTHPTTRLCLEWLDGHSMPNEIIDYGCGSGILAIAAALLGAEHVECIDTDPQALQATIDNAQRNKVSNRLKTGLPEQQSGKPVELLLANILAGPLIELAPKLAKLVKSGGEIVLSGILTEQWVDVSKAYEKWFEMQQPTEIDGWIRLHGRRLELS